MSEIWRDVKHGARMLVKNPGFSFVAIISIAIGVGANAGMFSVADTLVLRPLPVPRAGDIVNVSSVVPRTGFQSPTSAALSYPDYLDVRDRARSFDSLVAYQLVVAGFTERSDQPAQRKFGLAGSGNLFDALGVTAAVGRSFGVEEDRVAGRDAVVVLDHEMWRRDFNADPAVVGRSVRIGSIDMTVIGVMPAGFTGPDQFVQPGYYIPLAMLPSLQVGVPADALMRRNLRNLLVKGRLKSGISVSQASEEVRLIAGDLERTFPATNRNQGLIVRTELGARIAARPPLAVAALMLMTLAFVVLLVACANVAGLLTSRAPVRAREMALKLAIGAGRLRLIRQLIIESLLIAAGGAVVGLAVGYGVIRMFQRLQIPTDVPLKFSFDLNERVVMLAIGVAALSALVSSIVPALRSSRGDLITVMKPTAAESRQSRLWGRNILVCSQVAFSLVLLTVSVFLYRAFQLELGRGPGFRTERILMMTFNPELARYDPGRADAFYQLLTDRSRALPTVTSVTVASAPPMDPINIENTTIVPEGFQLPAGTENVRVLSTRIDEEYFNTLEVPILQGRAFRPTDTAGTPRVAIVNQTFARRYWPGQDAIGKRLRATGEDQGWIEIVGVAANTRLRSLSEGPTEFVYYPRKQSSRQTWTRGTLLVASEENPTALAAPLRDAVRAIDPNMPVFEVRTMEEFHYANSVTNSTLLIQTVAGMGSMGLLLAIVGLYGLVAYSVSRRTREIGVRMAVGAAPGSVLRMVLRQGLLLAASGVIVGVISSVATNGLLRAAFPFPSVEAVDVTTYLLVVPALLVVTLLAAYIPARRAARIDPMLALRQE